LSVIVAVMMCCVKRSVWMFLGGMVVMVKLMIVHGMQGVTSDVNHWVLPMRMMVTQQILHAVFVVVVLNC